MFHVEHTTQSQFQSKEKCMHVVFKQKEDSASDMKIFYKTVQGELRIIVQEKITKQVLHLDIMMEVHLQDIRTNL